MMSPLDRLIISFDNGMRTLLTQSQAVRPLPASMESAENLSDQAKIESARLMRVNHAGEVCAQALYQGQALTARNASAREALEQAARDEIDHLAWCESRLAALGGGKSVLNPLWYAGSFAMGAAAGLLGDKWNMAFLAETERQVEGHLTEHLSRLPAEDKHSYVVVDQMRVDEARHAQTAMDHGAAEMPGPVKRAMQLGSKIMTTTSYWV
jgi:3-demethoxyubiquinol 3-hydroxylase